MLRRKFLVAAQRQTAEQLRQTLHDGLCQQLAGSVLLQAVLIKHLEQVAGTDDALRQVVADARRVEETLREALEETRRVMREIG